MSLECPMCGMTRPVGSVALIQGIVAAYYRLQPEDMRSDRRSRRVAWPRQTAMYLARELTPKSFPNIGRLFGNRDHTTVMHAIAAVERRIESDRDLAADIVALKNRIMGAVDNQLHSEDAQSKMLKGNSVNGQEELAAV